MLGCKQGAIWGSCLIYENYMPQKGSLALATCLPPKHYHCIKAGKEDGNIGNIIQSYT